jgi:DNA-directed RNA polymerase subunit M/transcription elongation factor TFIIS
LAFSVHPVISEVPKVILYATADALTMTDLGVKANLDPTTWAGAFDCSACGRKRLPAVEFSKNMVLKRQKDENAKIRCKTCTAADEVKEREAAAAKAKARAAEETGDDVVLHECAKCKESKPASDFSGKQLRQKGPGKTEVLGVPGGRAGRRAAGGGREGGRAGQVANGDGQG